MSKEYKTTEFSLHISRSKMRRYLHNALSAREQQEVDLHLKHCSHCSASIVAYVENEEPEHYKAHMSKLKGKLADDVKPSKRKFSQGRIKVIRAAAAVAALFVFSFFALNTMVEKDFNLISQAEKSGNELPKLGASKKSPKPKVSTSIPVEKKTDEVKEEAEDIEETQSAEKPKVAAKKKVAKANPQPKPAVAKAETKVESVKENATVDKVEKKATPQTSLAEAEISKPVESTKKEEKAESKDEETEEKPAEKVESVQPLQKIEKIEVAPEKSVSPEVNNVQSLPNKSVGQLRK